MSVKTLLLILGLPALMARPARAEESVIVTDRGLPTGITNPTATPPPPVNSAPYTLPSTMTTAQNNDGLMGVCATALSGLFGMANLVMKEADEENERRGYRDVEDMEPEVQSRVSKNIRAHMSGKCSDLIDKDGKPGPWAHTAISEIREKPDAYVNNDPPDILKLCPGYAKMGKGKGGEREGFWLWVFASIASSESSCNPSIVNPKCNRSDAARTGCKYNANSPPNGDALGLFQLEPNKCGGVSRETLLTAGPNIRCAVRLLGHELLKRDSLMGCNREKNGRHEIINSRDIASSPTYWGPLNACTRHAGDGNAVEKTLKLIPKYTGC